MRLEKSSGMLSPRTTGDIHGPVLSLVRELQPDRNAKILDLGCGSGALLRRLSLEQGYSRLVGVDISKPVSISFGADFLEADLDHLALPFADGSVDVVLMVEVVEHILNLSIFLEEVSRVLSCDGFVVLTTPNLHSLESRLRYLLAGRLRQFDFRGDPTHVSPIFLFPFARALTWHGLSISRVLGLPVNGSSPTSTLPLRLLARLLCIAGVKAFPPGDTLCLVIEKKSQSIQADFKAKQKIITSHYF